MLQYPRMYRFSILEYFPGCLGNDILDLKIHRNSKKMTRLQRNKFLIIVVKI